MLNLHMGSMTVSELARASGVTPDAVRYYSRKGLLSPQRNSANGYRQFAESDLKRLRFIKQAQALGFSLSDIAIILAQARRKKSPCPTVRTIIQRHIEQAGRELEELMLLRDRMKAAVAKWSRIPDSYPDGDEVCRLIESVDIEGEVASRPARVAARRKICSKAMLS